MPLHATLHINHNKYYILISKHQDYGNEREAGRGVARAIADGLVQRSDLFIASKLWNSFHEPARVEQLCRKQLHDWGLDYFDLFLIHFPIALPYVDPATRYPPGWADESGTAVRAAPVPLQETWQAMEGLVSSEGSSSSSEKADSGKGLARSIGISNYNGALVLDLLRYARVRPAVLQIEHHPYLVQQQLLDLCRREGVAVTAYSSFGPQSFIELDVKAAKEATPLFENEAVRRIAKKHGRTPAQVLLRWATQRGIAVIPKSNHPERLAQNLDVGGGGGGFELGGEEVEELCGLDRGLRFNDPLNVSWKVLGNMFCSKKWKYALVFRLLTDLLVTVRCALSNLCLGGMGKMRGYGLVLTIDDLMMYEMVNKIEAGLSRIRIACLQSSNSFSKI